MKNRLRICFNEIKSHAIERINFRQRLHRFLKIRATFLLDRAFAGLTKFARERLL